MHFCASLTKIHNVLLFSIWNQRYMLLGHDRPVGVVCDHVCTDKIVLVNLKTCSSQFFCRQTPDIWSLLPSYGAMSAHRIGNRYWLWISFTVLKIHLFELFFKLFGSAVNKSHIVYTLNCIYTLSTLDDWNKIAVI